MHKWMQRVTGRLVAGGMVPTAQAEWCTYCLEKKVCTGLSILVLAALGCLFTHFTAAMAFIFCLFFLRTKTNGYHAESYTKCLLISAVSEVICLGLLARLLPPVALALLALAGCGVIFKLAPYNHPNMHLNPLEVVACRRSARVRLLLLVLAGASFAALGLKQVSAAVALGIGLAALLLGVAYIKENQAHEEQQGKKSGSKTCDGDDQARNVGVAP